MIALPMFTDISLIFLSSSVSVLYGVILANATPDVSRTFSFSFFNQLKSYPKVKRYYKYFCNISPIFLSTKFVFYIL